MCGEHFSFKYFPNNAFALKISSKIVRLAVVAVSIDEQTQTLVAPNEAGWPGHYINVRRYSGLSMVPLQLKDPLELFVMRREFLPSSKFLFIMMLSMT